MMILLKILLSPISLVLLMFCVIARLVLGFTGIFTNILSFIFVALGCITLFSIYLGSDMLADNGFKDVLMMFFIAFLFSEFGLMGILNFIVDKADDLRYAISDI